MKPRSIAVILMTVSLGALGSIAAYAQHQGHTTKSGPPRSATQIKQDMANDHMRMAHEPHHVLAMAYHHNLGTFATALQEQAVRTGPLHVEFARSAVAEMRRSFDQMRSHHQQHMTTMSAAMHTRMDDMMKKMETHRDELNGQIVSLEQEVSLATPDARNVSRLAARVNTHLAAMAKMHTDGKGTRMTMKM